jgi:hypothetical protein
MHKHKLASFCCVPGFELAPPACPLATIEKNHVLNVAFGLAALCQAKTTPSPQLLA